MKISAEIRGHTRKLERLGGGSEGGMAEEQRCRRPEAVAAVLRRDSTTARDLRALSRLPSVQHWALHDLYYIFIFAYLPEKLFYLDKNKKENNNTLWRWWGGGGMRRPGAARAKRSQIAVGSPAVDHRRSVLASLFRCFRIFKSHLFDIF